MLDRRKNKDTMSDRLCAAGPPTFKYLELIKGVSRARQSDSNIGGIKKFLLGPFPPSFLSSN